MLFDRQEGNHAWATDRSKCAICGMAREHYEDRGKPPCRGRPAQIPDEVREIRDDT